MNLVGGDPYGSDCSLDLSFLWRPSRATRDHETHVAHLRQVGAARDEATVAPSRTYAIRRRHA